MNLLTRLSFPTPKCASVRLFDFEVSDLLEDALNYICPDRLEEGIVPPAFDAPEDDLAMDVDWPASPVPESGPGRAAPHTEAPARKTQRANKTTRDDGKKTAGRASAKKGKACAQEPGKPPAGSLPTYFIFLTLILFASRPLPNACA